MFANMNYAKVWKIYPPDKKEQKYTKVQISTSRKQKDGSYLTDYSGYVRLVGKAFEKSHELEANDTIKILNCGVSTSYDKKNNKNYETFVVFDFEFSNKNKENAVSGDGSDFMTLPDDAKLPFED